MLFKILYLYSADVQKRKLLYDEPQRKYYPGYLAATMADAFADLIRAKADAKYNKTQVMPQPQPAPSKEKSFAYTSIRLSSSEQGRAPTPAPTLLPESVPEVAISGPRGPTSINSPLVTQQTQSGSQPFVTSQSRDDIDTKMAELEAEMSELSRMKEEMEALKKQIEQEKQGGPSRRLLDSGAPGWDPGVLLEKVR